MASKDVDEDVEDRNQDLDDETLLKHAVHYTVYKMSQDCGRHFNMEFSKSVVATVADNVFQTIPAWGRDLELFAKHAKRKSINPEDVRLLFRNNAAVYKQLGTMMEHIDDRRVKRAEERQEKRKRKKTENAGKDGSVSLKKSKSGSSTSKNSDDVIPISRKAADEDIETIPSTSNKAQVADLDARFENDFDDFF